MSELTSERSHPAPDSSRASVEEVLRARRRRRVRETIAVNLARVALAALLLGSWELAARTGVVNPFFWSMPSQVWHQFIRAVENGGIATDVWYTTRASLLGFAVGTAAGTAFGLALWWSRFLDRVFSPYLVGFNAMPKVALAPLLTVSFGLGLLAKVMMAVLLVAVIAAIAARDGIRSADPDLEALLRSLGAKRRQIFAKLVVPATLPWIFSAFRINIGLAMIGTVVAEFIGGERGLGVVAVKASATYDIATVWVAVLLLAVLAVLMYWVVERLQIFLMKGVLHEVERDRH